MFSNKDLERYSRQIILKKVGILGQKKIQNSKVLGVGCGGLGAPVIDLLSRAGVGVIGMMDHDKVSLSNLHRQIMFTADDVGEYKVNISSAFSNTGFSSTGMTKGSAGTSRGLISEDHDNSRTTSQLPIITSQDSNGAYTDFSSSSTNMAGDLA